jgi:hypothetical protein
MPDSCANGRGVLAPSQDSAGSSGSSSGGGGGVNVIKQEVVGPYETVQLQATTPNALEDYLTKNGFALPADVKPIVDKYVSENFNFLALKLLPGKGVQDMRPVRVTSQGAGVTLPLRMVGAGTGATVGISLWVVSEGRYETQNFPSFHIADDELAWDWTLQKSNYTDLRAQKTAAGGGRIWEIESSIALDPQQLESYVYGGYFPNQDPTAAEQQAQNDYLPVKDTSGTVIKTAVQARDDDFATIFAGIASARVTRIRGDIAHAKLDADLVMTASTDQGLLSNHRKVTKELNEPLCPVYQGCQQVGTAPRSQVLGSPGGGHESFGCTTTTRSKYAAATPAFLVVAAGAIALAIAKAKRRRP